MTRDSPGVTATDSLSPVSVAATAWTEHDARTQQEVDPRGRHPRIEATRTMDALAVLDALIAQPGRHAVLRRELVEDLQRRGKTPASATRALQRRCADGSLTRVGAGIYAIGQSRIADIVPEVLPKLGYRFLDTPARRTCRCEGSRSSAVRHSRGPDRGSGRGRSWLAGESRYVRQQFRSRSLRLGRKLSSAAQTVQPVSWRNPIHAEVSFRQSWREARKRRR